MVYNVWGHISIYILWVLPFCSMLGDMRFEFFIIFFLTSCLFTFSEFFFMKRKFNFFLLSLKSFRDAVNLNSILLYSRRLLHNNPLRFGCFLFLVWIRTSKNKNWGIKIIVINNWDRVALEGILLDLEVAAVKKLI